MQIFDELLLLKRGGRVIYNGPTGMQSAALVSYFEGIAGVPKLQEGISPATWMLDISTVSAEERLGRDFADIFNESELFRSAAFACADRRSIVPYVQFKLDHPFQMKTFSRVAHAGIVPNFPAFLPFFA